VFFIPFLIFFFLIAIPLFTLETLLGQIFKKGPVEVFAMIRKQFAGIGWAQIIVSWIISIYYAIILCWSVYYFFLSFTYPLPWSKEAMLKNLSANNTLSRNYTNTSINSSYTFNQSVNEDEDYVNLDFFPKEVLRISSGIENIGSINWNMAGCLVITYILIFVCIIEGIKTSSKVVYFTAPAPLVLLLILLFK
jgi:SNF family Na+-dependent transporter